LPEREREGGREKERERKRERQEKKNNNKKKEWKKGRQGGSPHDGKRKNCPLALLSSPEAERGCVRERERKLGRALPCPDPTTHFPKIVEGLQGGVRVEEVTQPGSSACTPLSPCLPDL
jgi:hypothetical protein